MVTPEAEDKLNANVLVEVYVSYHSVGDTGTLACNYMGPNTMPSFRFTGQTEIRITCPTCNNHNVKITVI